MTRAYFVTGTDTGVGKTFVSAALLRACRARGLAAAALKPAESGCPRAPDGSLLPEDALQLRAAAGLDDLPLEAIVPHRYHAPLAPAVAARDEPPPFSLARTRACLDALRARDPALLLVEGAGGLLVPYTDELLAADVALALALPILIVARAGLGTINHTLLTVNEARRRGLPIAGIVLNAATAASDPSQPSNGAEIARLGQVRILATVVHGASPPPTLLDDLLG